jgi:ABC-type Zn uptake system ZnuABC Zn-binding protein ZnuA
VPLVATRCRSRRSSTTRPRTRTRTRAPRRTPRRAEHEDLLGNGGRYDDFFTKLADQAPGAKNLVAYDIAATGNQNEHVWYNLPSVEKVADQVATQLGDLQPVSKQAFLDNATAFKTKAERRRWCSR